MPTSPKKRFTLQEEKEAGSLSSSPSSPFEMISSSSSSPEDASPQSPSQALRFAAFTLEDSDNENVYESLESEDDDNDLDNDQDDGFMFPFENEKPFWFCNEEHAHLKSIVRAYHKALNIDSRNVLSPRCDSRRYPVFIGRIERVPIETDELDFTTLDTVEVFRRDLRPVGSPLTLMFKNHFITMWDSDGIPKSQSEIRQPAIEEALESKIESLSPSFIHCFPAWESQTEFCYKVGKQKEELSYANQPLHCTQFVPPYLEQKPSVNNCVI